LRGDKNFYFEDLLYQKGEISLGDWKIPNWQEVGN
jgi:hypothetical protein